ncbi:MAG TPA: pilus assembly protein TadG-related protein [Gemmatimonadaceae bacterium]
MPHLKSRRGAIVVMLGIMMVSLMAITALSLDFSRLWTLRNELQTSADAAAHAGAIQLLPPNNAGATDSATRAMASANLAMADTVTIDSVILGDWDDAARVFTPGAAHTDAVSVVVSRQSTGLVMAMLGVPLPRLKARAIGWADAPVNNSAGCIKPVAVPFTQLMWRINVFRGIPNTPDTLGMYRPFDQVDDLAALGAMTASERTFSLKIGSGQLADTLGALAGNYQAVKLGRYWDVSTGALAVPGPDNGGAGAYKGHLSGTTCHTLTVGDSLITEPGNMVQPTICGAWPGAQGCGGTTGPGICSVIRGDKADPFNTPQSSTSYGDCEDAGGGAGVDMKAAFYQCSVGCNGQSTVEVSLLGSFTLTKVFPDKSQGGAYTSFDQAEIVGIFKPVGDPGTVGPGSTTLVRPILVK